MSNRECKVCGAVVRERILRQIGAPCARCLARFVMSEGDDFFAVPSSVAQRGRAAGEGLAAQGHVADALLSPFRHGGK